MQSDVAEDRISCIIAAAGANTRLKGNVASFLKPTLLVDGKPLINHAVTHALTWGVERCDTTIVASPHNAIILPQLATHHELNWVLQPKPDGVVDAIKRASPFLRHEWTLFLCADNLFENRSESGYFKMVLEDNIVQSFSCRRLPVSQGHRFTSFSERDNKFYKAREGNVNASASGPIGLDCWIGPLLIRTSILQKALCMTLDIVLLLNIIHELEPITPLRMKCSDMGVMEELHA